VAIDSNQPMRNKAGCCQPMRNSAGQQLEGTLSNLRTPYLRTTYLRTPYLRMPFTPNEIAPNTKLVRMILLSERVLSERPCSECEISPKVAKQLVYSFQLCCGTRIIFFVLNSVGEPYHRNEMDPKVPKNLPTFHYC
jgi:hypothetical protein